MKMIWQDYLIILSVVFYLSAHSITQAGYEYYKNVTEEVEDAKLLFKFSEQNPFAYQIITSSTQFRYVLAIVIIPSLLITVYVLARIGRLKLDPILFDFLTLIVFLYMLFDFLNDLPMAIVYIIKLLG